MKWFAAHLIMKSIRKYLIPEELIEDWSPEYAFDEKMQKKFVIHDYVGFINKIWNRLTENEMYLKQS